MEINLKDTFVMGSVGVVTGIGYYVCVLLKCYINKMNPFSTS